MNSRLILPAVLGAFLLSTPAFALAPGNAHKDEHDHRVSDWWLADQCRSLQTQFDQAMKTNGKGDNVANAKTMRDDGAAMCSQGNYTRGISQLRLALKDLGVTPKT